MGDFFKILNLHKHLRTFTFIYPVFIPVTLGQPRQTTICNANFPHSEPLNQRRQWTLQQFRKSGWISEDQPLLRPYEL